MNLTPGPQPHNAGITPGFTHLAPRQGEHIPATRGDLRRFARRLRRHAIHRMNAEAQVIGQILADLLDRVEALERRAGQ